MKSHHYHRQCNSQSYLKFDDADELYRFIRFALRFSKVSEWQLELDMPKHERSQVKAQWQKIDADLSIKISTNEVLSEKFKNRIPWPEKQYIVSNI